MFPSIPNRIRTLPSHLTGSPPPSFSRLSLPAFPLPPLPPPIRFPINHVTPARSLTHPRCLLLRLHTPSLHFTPRFSSDPVQPSLLLLFFSPSLFSSAPLPTPLPPPVLPSSRTIRRLTWSTFITGLTACARRMRAPTNSSPPPPSTWRPWTWTPSRPPGRPWSRSATSATHTSPPPPSSLSRSRLSAATCQPKRQPASPSGPCRTTELGALPAAGPQRRLLSQPHQNNVQHPVSAHPGPQLQLRQRPGQGYLHIDCRGSWACELKTKKRYM